MDHQRQAGQVRGAPRRGEGRPVLLARYLAAEADLDAHDEVGVLLGRRRRALGVDVLLSDQLPHAVGHTGGADIE